MSFDNSRSDLKKVEDDRRSDNNVVNNYDALLDIRSTAQVLHTDDEDRSSSHGTHHQTN